MTTVPIATDRPWVPDACTLPTTEQPLRLAEFDGLFASHVHEVQRISPRRVRLVLEFSPDVAEQAAGLAARESHCCAFFTFTQVIAPAELALEIVVPESQTAVLAALADRAEAAGSR
jgi:hypothetical protein